MTDVTDNFNRAGPALGSNWTTGVSSVVISASTVITCSTGGGDGTAWWNANAFSGDHYSQIVYKTDADGGGPTVRYQSGADTFYELYTNNAVLQVYEVTAFTYAQLGADYANNPAVNDVFKLDATGSILTPSLNGTPLATRTDSSITGGAPGIHCFSNVITFDDWLGGPIIDVVVATNLMPQILM